MSSQESAADIAIRTRDLNLWYGHYQALFAVNLQIKRWIITAMIGPSGCGKSTVLRSVDRINERLGYVRIDGAIEVLGKNIYDPDVHLAQLRKQVGMVFQRPNPLPISLYDNVLFGHRLHRSADERFSKEEEDGLVEAALRRVLLWEKVKD
ncbi:phosphate ABC transporter ATP-binding protein, partial [Candidatus Magnetaquicoccus inordinatus]|uniref:phosphate ABC transporter ATP-binding protein n=1 Tax=Candidatus Magnetaquicoccus inordinatus TaxID=2496818 RepID=UPI00102D1B6D